MGGRQRWRSAAEQKSQVDPLVKFVSRALSLVGMSRSPETVSAVLRGRPLARRGRTKFGIKKVH